MRHQEAGRKLGVSADHRRAMLRSLTLAIIEHDSITTTNARAKELRWYAEHVVTLAKRGDVASRRQIISLLGCTETKHGKVNRVRTAIDRIYTDLVPRFKDRNGGYTQILRLAKRRVGDNADMCVMRYLPVLDEKSKKSKTKGDKKKAAEQKAAPKDQAVEAKKPREKKVAEPKESKPKKKEKVEDKT
jgi:large subunit ribosomal protein L17